MFGVYFLVLSSDRYFKFVVLASRKFRPSFRSFNLSLTVIRIHVIDRIMIFVLQRQICLVIHLSSATDLCWQVTPLNCNDRYFLISATSVYISLLAQN